MRETAAPPATITTAENAQDILGQFYYAFGQGAGAMRVERAAIAALRRRYFRNIQTAPAPWNAISGNVLSLVAQVGRMAALLATQAGRTAISESDFIRARKMVEAHAHGEAPAGQLIAGPLCTMVPDDIVDQPLTDPATLGGDEAHLPAPARDDLRFGTH